MGCSCLEGVDLALELRLLGGVLVEEVAVLFLEGHQLCAGGAEGGLVDGGGVGREGDGGEELGLGLGQLLGHRLVLGAHVLHVLPQSLRLDKVLLLSLGKQPLHIGERLLQLLRLLLVPASSASSKPSAAAATACASRGSRGLSLLLGSSQALFVLLLLLAPVIGVLLQLVDRLLQVLELPNADSHFLRHSCHTLLAEPAPPTPSLFRGPI
mmetsp:Transcript_15512/g.60677  ORF Transcript_15512/g.60677 Transcript_15512/m.60677 type:complete len:211 (+) Transcript_15512:2507-3139(+)